VAAAGAVQGHVACDVVRSVGCEACGGAGRQGVVSSLLRLLDERSNPERTTFVRFRKALVSQALDKALFDEITAQLKAKAIRVKTGTFVDATVIASASAEDGEARRVKHKGRAAVHGFKAHVGADANTALVEEAAVTPANVNDGKAGPDALPDAPGEVFADSGYRGRLSERWCASREAPCARRRHRHVGPGRGRNVGVP
jgi:IS5 family transposase